MTWIFGSFLVTLCALTSCHVVISKQGMKVRQDGGCVTRRRPHDNHAVRFRQKAENRSRARNTQPVRGFKPFDDTACTGVQALAPPGSRKKILDKKKSPLWVYISPSISQLISNGGLLSRIKWEIYFYKEGFRSFIEVRKSGMRVYNKFSKFQRYHRFFSHVFNARAGVI